MENFLNKIKKTGDYIKQAPVNLQKKIIEKTTLGLDRSIPEPNPIDNTINEVNNYRKQIETTDMETNRDTYQKENISKTEKLDTAA